MSILRQFLALAQLKVEVTPDPESTVVPTPGPNKSGRTLMRLVKASQGSDRGFGPHKSPDTPRFSDMQKYANIVGDDLSYMPVGLVDPRTGDALDVYFSAHHYWAQKKPGWIAELFLDGPDAQVEQINTRYQTYVNNRLERHDDETELSFQLELQEALARELVLRSLYYFMRNEIFHANDVETASAAWLAEHGLSHRAVKRFTQDAQRLCTKDQIKELARKLKAAHDRSSRAKVHS